MKIGVKKEDGTLKLEMTGRLDTTTAPQLEEVFCKHSADIKHLIMDCSNLEYMSSAGLRVVLIAHKTMIGQGGTMVVCGVNAEIKEVFDITGFSKFLKIE